MSDQEGTVEEKRTLRTRFAIRSMEDTFAGKPMFAGKNHPTVAYHLKHARLFDTHQEADTFRQYGFNRPDDWMVVTILELA